MSWLQQIMAADTDVVAARRALLQAGEEISGSGTWAWDLGTGQRLWSQNMFKILDADPQGGPSSVEAVLQRVHPDDRLRFWRAYEQAGNGGGAVMIRYRIRTRSGTVRFVQAIVAAKIPVEGRVVLVGWLRDVTEADRAEREIAVHIAVSESLSLWDGFDDGGRRLICELAGVLGFDRAVLWIVIDDVLAPKVIWHAAEDEAHQQIMSMRLSPGHGLAGVAWETGVPVSHARVAEEAEYQFGEAAAREGLRGAVAVPIIGSGGVFGVMSLSGPDELEMTDRLRATLTGIGYEVGAFLERRSSEWNDRCLTAREVQILQLASDGLSGPAVAARLVISQATVKTHFEHIYAKYDVPDRVAAVAKALRQGLIH